jgi:hypothetical protein
MRSGEKMPRTIIDVNARAAVLVADHRRFQSVAGHPRAIIQYSFDAERFRGLKIPVMLQVGAGHGW